MLPDQIPNAPKQRRIGRPHSTRFNQKMKGVDSLFCQYFYRPYYFTSFLNVPRYQFRKPGTRNLPLSVRPILISYSSLSPSSHIHQPSFSSDLTLFDDPSPSPPSFPTLTFHFLLHLKGYPTPLQRYSLSQSTGITPRHNTYKSLPMLFHRSSGRSNPTYYNFHKT